MVGVKKLLCLFSAAVVVLASRSTPLIRWNQVQSSHPSVDSVKVSIKHHDASSISDNAHMKKQPPLAKEFSMKSKHQLKPGYFLSQSNKQSNNNNDNDLTTLDDNKPVDILDFLTDTKNAIADVSKGLIDYKPYDKKEEPIDKAMDQLENLFNPHHNFSQHELSHDSQLKVANLLHDLAFSTDDLYDGVIEKRKHFEHEYAVGLGKRFHALQKSGQTLTDWVGKALNAGWREKDLEYWRHAVSVFRAVGDALGDFEDESVGVRRDSTLKVKTMGKKGPKRPVMRLRFELA